MGVAEDRPGFLSRWARRKNDVLQGKPVDEPAAPVNNSSVAADPASSALISTHSEIEAASQTPLPEKLLSLDDVKLLTQQSDFKPFMAGNVSSDVRNAAMKKLFTDPHYNVMDGLDIYISDYSIADPIPESMLRQMVGAKLLKIFGDEDDDDNKDKNDRIDNAAVDKPALAAKQEVAALVSPKNVATHAADESETASTLFLEETSAPMVTPVLGTEPLLVLPAPQETDQSGHFVANVSNLGSSCDASGLLRKA